MKSLVLVGAVVASAVAAVAAPAADRAASPCGLSGNWRILSGRIDYDAGGAGVMPTGTRLLTLSGSRWAYGSSSGSFRVAAITSADWKRWSIDPYGPMRKIVLSGWAGRQASGPIEERGSTVDFFWVVYRAAPPVVGRAGTVELKFGHSPIPRNCSTQGSTPAAAELTAVPAAIKAGDDVTYDGSGFLPNELIDITEQYTLDGVAHTSGLLGGSADAKGRVHFVHPTIPNITPLGKHTICVTGKSGRKACASFTVT